jgi:hypothetical protein
MACLRPDANDVRFIGVMRRVVYDNTARKPARYQTGGQQCARMFLSLYKRFSSSTAQHVLMKYLLQ